MIRQADKQDVAAIAAIYEAILDQEERGNTTVGWARGVYPTADTAADAVAKGTMFVLEEGGIIVAAAKIDQQQVDVYADCHWEREAPASEVLVLHTLVVDPKSARHGYGRQFVAFYETYAKDHGCRELRMDTNERNTTARALYRGLGYREVGIVPCVFNGISGVRLVCLEKML